jgi:TRAP-type C4-dicarboxylate transport system permease small subunit
MTELADRLPPRLGKTVKWMVAIKLNVCATATLILPITFTLVVIFRYIFHLDLFAYEEWLLPISFWLYFLASGVASYEDSQIRADVLESLFRTPSAIWRRRVILNIVETSISLVVLYWAALMMLREIGSYPFWQKTIALQIPFAAPRLGIFIGLFFMAFYGLLHLYVLLKFGHSSVEEKLTVDENEIGKA